MFEKTDEQLIDKALQGNRNAWLKLVKRYEKSIYNYGLRMTSNPDDALDLMQEIFTSVFRNLATYRGDGVFKAWLFRIASYRTVEFYRRKKPTQGLDELPEIESESDKPEELLMMKSHNQQLLGALQELPIAQRAVVELKFFGQFTFEEIAEQLNVSSNTVKSRLYSALDKLKQKLEVEYV